MEDLMLIKVEGGSAARWFKGVAFCIILALAVSVVVTGYIDSTYRPENYEVLAVGYYGKIVEFDKNDNEIDFVALSDGLQNMLAAAVEDPEYPISFPCQDTTANWQKRDFTLWIEIEVDNEKYKKMLFGINEGRDRQGLLVFCARYEGTYNGGDIMFYRNAQAGQLIEEIRKIAARN